MTKSSSSSSWKSSSNVAVVATIDLHGYKKADAISRLTEFLEQVKRENSKKGGAGTCSCWVEVVTGSGSHSQHGPVLRGAVQALFEKREMKWRLQGKGRASFLVDASSGIVLYEPEQPRDSKVTVASSLSGEELPIKLWSNVTKGQSNHGKPLDPETKAASKLLKKSFSEKRNEEKALKRALSASAGEAEREKEEEESVLKKAISLSVLDSKAEIEEEETLRQAMALSAQEFKMVEDEEGALLKAIEMSREANRTYEHEDEELLRALEQSMLDF
mmetsp:Transcript_641/g.1194  ORF Transcript_641/g.1194 Transcript_641/m.1194 type:complete len:274 (-) Transcript_641:63-884(-)